MTDAPRISFAAGKEILDKYPQAVLLDVRTEEEYSAEHAAGAVNLPVEELCGILAAELIPTTDTPVLVYCRSGNRSAAAGRKLGLLGYTNLYDLGGLNGWPYGMDIG